MKIFLVLLFLASNGFAATIPLQDFFKNPVAAGFLISPNGKKLAYLKPWEGRMNLFVREIAGTGNEKRVTSNKDRDMADFFWKENQLYYSKDFNGDENFHVFQVNLETGIEKDLTPFEKTRANVISTLKDANPNEMLITHNHRDAKIMDVYRVNVKTGKLVLMLQNPGDYEEYGVDFKGQIRTVARSAGTETEILYRDNNKQGFKPLLKFDYTRNFQPLLFSEKNATFYALSNLGRDKESIVLFDPQTKKEEIIYQHTDYDAGMPGLAEPLIYSHKLKKVLGENLMTWKLQQVFYDTDTEKMFHSVQEQSGLRNANVVLLSNDDAENTFTFLMTSDRVRGKFYLYDKKSDKVTFLDQAAPWLKADDLAEVKPVEFVTRDGLIVRGYVTLPSGYNGKPVPTIVNPHGGPWYRDFWRYNAEVQFLANRGYAVLQLNFRGSTGYGRNFLMASYKQWGLKMQDDITDGTKWLVQQSIADSKKICIYGGSYGGYATLMGLVKEPDLYACGVDYVGVSNLFTFLKTIPPYWALEMEKMYVMLGHPEKDKDQFTKTSPALNVEKIKAPLFIAQGAQDPRVDKDESDQMVKKLKARGIDVPYLVKDNEGHGFHNEENKFDFYGQMEKFLAKHLK